MSEHAALLQIDIVDSTKLGEALGDEAMSALWTEHDRLARDLLREWHGREIDKSDGFLLLFAEAADAVGYALTYHDDIARLSTRLGARAGVHVGRIVMRANPARDVALGAKPLEVDGVAKSIVARVMSMAMAGQTLLTCDARNLLGTPDIEVQSHGHWRLKGIDEPLEVFQAVRANGAFAIPIDSEKAWQVLRRDDLWLPRREVRNTLPAERDSFIGRQDPLRALGKRFDLGARLVSLLGVGGTGKTRLAQRFGWTRLGDFPGGVWFCDLAPATSLDGIARAVAQGLDVPLGSADAVAQLDGAIAGRGRCLLVLDNFEQVTAHAAATVGRWLDRAAEASFLVTTREVLGLVGEQVVTLLPLRSDEASQLFLERAAAADDTFCPGVDERSAVLRIVALLDGLPLAIELAASRVRMFSPRQILDRMAERFSLLTSRGGRPGRQSTMRAALDWSWDLLTSVEKDVLAQLSVFRGGFTSESAEAIVDLRRHRPALPVVDVLQALIDKSLVRSTGSRRFGLLSIVEEYAQEQLGSWGRVDGRGPAEAREAEERHGRHFADFTAAKAVADSCVELENLVVACRRAVERDSSVVAVGALRAAWEALDRRGPFGAGHELAVNAARLSSAGPLERLRIEVVAGRAQFRCGRLAEARAVFEAALALALSIGHRESEGQLLNLLAAIDVFDGKMATLARSRFAEALGIAREIGDQLLECNVLNGLGTCEKFLGNLADAGLDFEAALVKAKVIKNRRAEGGSLGNLGQLRANQGKAADARRFYADALSIARELGDRQWEGNTLCNIGLLEQTEGRLPEAVANLELALAIATDLGYVRLEAVVLCNIGLVHAAAERWDMAEAHYRSALEVARKLKDRRLEGQFLNYLGVAHMRRGEYGTAGTCLADGAALLEAVSDKMYLGLILCSQAENAHRAGRVRAALEHISKARNLAASVAPEPTSEFGTALALVVSLLAGGARVAG